MRGSGRSLLLSVIQPIETVLSFKSIAESVFSTPKLGIRACLDNKGRTLHKCVNRNIVKRRAELEISYYAEVCLRSYRGYSIRQQSLNAEARRNSIQLCGKRKRQCRERTIAGCVFIPRSFLFIRRKRCHICFQSRFVLISFSVYSARKTCKSIISPYVDTVGMRPFHVCSVEERILSNAAYPDRIYGNRIFAAAEGILVYLSQR